MAITKKEVQMKEYYKHLDKENEMLSKKVKNLKLQVDYHLYSQQLAMIYKELEQAENQAANVPQGDTVEVKTDVKENEND